MSRSLKRVEFLKITFLVDNSIEWMSKLPPGFKHELRYHLADQKPPIDPHTGVPIADMENFCCGAHGFSALIETQVDSNSPPHLTLFDTGPDSKSLVRNISSMQTPIGEIERVVISHWHRDHSGGLLSFLKLRAKSAAPSPALVVDLHPNRPIARGIAPPPHDKVICRLPADPTFDEIEAAGGKVDLQAEGHGVGDNTVWISGEIPRVTPFECGLPGGMRWVEGAGKGEWVKEEDIMDERYAVIDVLGKGLVIFSACSHAGIVNVVRNAVTIFSRPIYMIIGGLHLSPPEVQSRIAPTVKFLSEDLRPAPTYILPMHCSGFGAKVALEEAFGEGCVPAGTGITVDVKGDHEVDGRILPMSL